MEMNGHLISDLNRFVDERGVTLAEAPGHVKLNIVRSGIVLSVLIPRTVLEWWVEVTDVAIGSTVEDWCDYAGYDATSAQALADTHENRRLEFRGECCCTPASHGRGRAHPAMECWRGLATGRSSCAA